MSNRSQEKAHPVLLNICIVFLIIFLMIGGSFYLITTDNAVIDDPATLAAQMPMPASERFAFDAAKETAQIKLDKSDLWWLLLPEMEENFLEEINKNLESYQLNINGYGFNITDEGLYIDLEAEYRSVRLPVHILTSLDFDASGFSMGLRKIKLGFLHLPIAKLFGSMDVRMDVDWPVVTDITDIAYQKDAVLLTGTLTQDMLSCVQDTCRNDAIGWFSTSHQVVFRAGREANGYRELLPGLAQDPGSIETLYHDLFTLSQVYEYENFMKETRNLSHRFFPGIDYDAWETENDSVRAQWTLCDGIADNLVTQVSADFNNRRFRLKNGKFYFRNAEFDVLNYYTGDAATEIQQMFEIIDPNKFHLILVGSINGYGVKSPALNWICAGEQQLTQELNRNDAYPVGCVFQGLNGEYFLRYESMQILEGGSKTSKLLKTVTLTEAEYAALVQEGRIGVWIS